MIAMGSLGRLLLRFILIPLGYLLAVLAGSLVILLGSWKLGQAAASPEGEAFMLFGWFVAAPLLFAVVLGTMWLPGAIGVLISELFAIRSWIFHAANGAVSAWIGWSMLGEVDDTGVPLNEPLAVIAAGLAGGLAYWAVAGSSAGFWKPVFRRSEQAALIAAGARRPQPR
jgi:hypothetical protein